MPQGRIFRRILFPTDFSKSSDAVAGHVAGLANVFGAKVWLLNVLPSLADFHGVSEYYFGPFSENALLTLEAERTIAAAHRLERLRCMQLRDFDQVDSEVFVHSGGVAESIVDFAAEKQTDLIMMPTRGFGPVRRFLIGSVTAKVLHDAGCPVWTSPHPRELEPFQCYRRVILAAEYCGMSSSLLMRAWELVQSLQARMSVLTAIPPRGAPGDETVQKQSREVAERLRAQIEDCNVQASVHAMEGHPGEVVRQVTDELEDADLIVIGRGHLDQSMGQLTTHAYEIIRNAPCPVVTL